MKKIAFLGWAALFALPWTVAYVFLPHQAIDLTCESSFELVKDAGSREEVRSYGTMTSDYHPDGTGMARYTGLLQTGKNGNRPRLFSVHRANDFHYELVGSFVKVTSKKAAKYLDDNAEDSMVGEYVYPGFNADSVEYFKMLNMGSGAVAAGVGAMPRVYCAPLVKSSTPQ